MRYAPTPGRVFVNLSALVLQLLNGLAGASALFLLSAGLTLIFGVTRIVNFAHGSLMMLGAYLAYSLIGALGGGAAYWVAVLLTALLIAVLGALIESLLLRHLYGAPELLQLLATFGVVLILKDVVLATWGPEDLLGPRAAGLRGAIDIVGGALPTYDIFLIFVGPGVLLALWWLIGHTRFGVLVRAASENRVMAAALGVNERLLFTAVFALGAGLAGLAGALQLPREPATLGMDLASIADAFVVTVVGGLGSIPGAFIAALMISLLKSLCIGLGTVNVAGVRHRVPETDTRRRVRAHGDRAGAQAARLARACAGHRGDNRARRISTRSARRSRIVLSWSAPSASLRWRCCRSRSTTTHWYSRPTCWYSHCSRRACACCSGPAA